ncbi:3-phosphoshikimate 1-carboxyvinyltransferase [Myroides pelagicus]|uniref:3-phosphoshikimate 1-carboxyvinyltransferase n=1 Tax=Myroides pelagicus TaxID=270914 RepID=UPI002DB6F737|nr:3-phosphoshikimate 1-carboxyvinyltransferase [Myroides pelagicus]MEC4114393.1 3-phosphoshikimate 1-carboxyvinyltransferase [Myroides pelagicus]
MKVLLPHIRLTSDQQVVISGSKSESNRLLILQELFDDLIIDNISDADDVQAMQRALASTGDVIDVHHAGTTMRFLTAYYALCTERHLTLTGSNRMQERPIGVLVDALKQLGADITYEKKEGYPPLRIKGHVSRGGNITLPANISSQYITALMLIGAKLSEGVTLDLIGDITSRPYIEMTLQLLDQLGAQTHFEENSIVVKPIQQVASTHFTVESDWSSASYFYSMIALSPVGTTIRLKSYKKNSLQGDSKVAFLYEQLGVDTQYTVDDIVQLTKVAEAKSDFQADLIETPDLAQTIAVSCFGLGVSCTLTGLHTLKIKETDRLLALQNELTKLGAEVTINEASLQIEKADCIQAMVTIDTYQDHRMALAFAPLALKVPIVINEAEVVTKSYIKYWQDLQKIGFQVEEQ